MVRKIVFPAVVFLVSSLFILAASPAVGTWDCVASVDMDYPFTLQITEENGEITGSVSNSYGESTAADKLKFENGQLSFSIDSPEVGMIDFKATLEGDSLTGTLEGYDFVGDFTGTRHK